MYTPDPAWKSRPDDYFDSDPVLEICPFCGTEWYLEDHDTGWCPYCLEDIDVD